MAADLRGTGYPDLFIANDYGVSELFLNEGGRFREVGRETGVGYAPKSGMNASVGDVLNQGKLAIYVSNISEEGILLQGNNLWVPTGSGRAAARVYENMARAMGIDLGGWSFGAQFGDLNNDGFLDLYLVNGYVSASRDESYWYDYSKVAGGHNVVIGDAANWPAMGARSLAGYQPKKVWINDGSGGIRRRRADGRRHRSARRPRRRARRFRRPRRARRRRRQPARAAAALQEPGRAGPPLDRLRSRGRLPGDAGSAPCSNRSAIGAQVEVFWNGRQQVQEVSGGSGFCAQNQRRLHFGLGAAAAVERSSSAGRRARRRSCRPRSRTGCTGSRSRMTSDDRALRRASAPCFG